MNSFEVFDAAGALVYRAVYAETAVIKDYRIPAKLILTDGQVTFQLRIQRFWPDVPLAASMFTLEEPSK